jgi:hypothetical protein
MQPGRHQVVHDVVAARYGVENIANEVRLFVGGHVLVTEMRCVIGVLLSHGSCSPPAGEDTQNRYQLPYFLGKVFGANPRIVVEIG